MILVTGATGNTGSEIIKHLSTAGAQVRALVRNREKATVIEGPGVEIVEGDLAKPETLDAALEGMEKAFLLSSVNPHQVKLQGNFVEAAKRAGLRHIVKQSAVGAGPDAPEGMTRWHWQTEQQISASGIPFTHLRPVFFMQTLLGYAPFIAMKSALALPMKDAKVSINMVDVRDIAGVAVKALTEAGHEGKTYTVTGPEMLTFEQIAEKLSVATGNKMPFVVLPPEVFKKEMLEAGQAESLADSAVAYFGSLTTGNTANAIVTNVVAEVAKKQPLSFDQFARDYVGAFKEAHLRVGGGLGRE